MSERSATVEVGFMPSGARVTVAPGTTLLAAARQATVAIPAECDGQGTCGKCRVVLARGEVRSSVSVHLDEQDLEGRVVLACQSVPVGDVDVLVPDADVGADGRQLARASRALAGADAQPPWDPLVRRLGLTRVPTSAAENASDADRLGEALRGPLGDETCVLDVAALRKLGHAVAHEQAQVRATLTWLDDRWHLVDIAAGSTGRDRVAGLGAAVDIGTSTLDACLVDLATGQPLDNASAPNRQAAHGADYITRIMALGRTTSAAELQATVVDGINQLVAGMVQSQRRSPDDVDLVVAAGNTAMIHLLLGLDPTMIRKAPYVPVSNDPGPVRAAGLGLRTADHALLYPLPGVAAFVGGDISAGVLATRMHERRGPALLIDVGTNGEIVLGGRDWMACASSSAGTAFEGTRFGMRGLPGAIERVRINAAAELELSVIGDARPRGLCGSGVLDLLAELFRTGVLERDGRLNVARGGWRLQRNDDDGWRYVVAPAQDTADGRPIFLSQADFANILRAKAGVAAAIRILMNLFEVGAADLEVVYLAGAFGSFIDVNHAIRIGLLPEVGCERVRYVGNTSLAGARRVLGSRAAWREVHQVAAAMTYVDLMTHPTYMDEFVQANFLPHTDPTRYPGVLAELGLPAR